MICENRGHMLHNYPGPLYFTVIDDIQQPLSFFCKISTDKQKKDPAAHLSTIAHTHTCREISYMHLVKFLSGVKNILMTAPFLPEKL